MEFTAKIRNYIFIIRTTLLTINYLWENFPEKLTYKIKQEFFESKYLIL